MPDEIKKSLVAEIRAEDKTREGFESASKNAEKAGSSFKELAGAVAVGTAAFEVAKAAISAVSGVISDSIKNALEDERVFSMLQNTIKIAGVSVDEANTAFASQVTKLKELGFAGADANASQGRFLQLTKDVTEAQKLSNLAAEVARNKNISLSEATDSLQRVLLNGGTAARKMGFDVSSTATNVEALDAIQKQAAGSAEAFANTTAGKLAIAQNAWEELKGELGSKFLPVLAQVATFITAIVTDPRMEAFLTLVGDIVNDYVVPAFSWLIKTISNVFTAASSIISGFGDIFGANADDMKATIQTIGEIVKILLTSLTVASLGVVTVFKAAIGTLFSFGKSVAATAAAIWNLLLDGIQTGLGYVNKSIGAAVDAYNAIATKLGGKSVSFGGFSVEKYKVDTSTIDNLKQGAADAMSATIGQFQKDLSTLGNFVSDQAKNGEVAKKAKDAGKSLSDGLAAGFDASKLKGLAKDAGGAAGDAAKAAIDQAFFDLKTQGDKVKAVIDESKKKTQEWADIVKSVDDGYHNVQDTLKKAGISVSGITDAQRSGAQTSKDAIASMISDMQKYATAAVDTKGKIEDITKQIASLKDEQSKAISGSTFDTTRSAAEAVANIQSAINDAQNKLSSGNLSDQDRTDLQKTLADNQALLAKHADFIKANSAEVARAQDLANSDEIERILKLGKEKTDAITKEYSDKLKAAQDSLALLQTQYADELTLLQQSNANIKAERDAAQKDYAGYLITAESLTNSHISAEIAKYNQLAAAVRNAAKGTSTSFTPDQNAQLTQYLNGVPKLAEGGIITRPTLAIVGEAGPEAVVPLNGSKGLGDVNVSIMEGAQITVTNEADENRLADTIARKLSRALQANRMGLATNI